MPSTPEIRNGLLDMETRRRAPRPRNPKLEVDVPPAPAPIATSAPGADVATPALESVAPATPPPAPRERLRAPACHTVRGLQIYIDNDGDKVLRDCREVGEVSNSAVIRLALAELAERMTPEEIVRTLLFGDNSAHRTPGRKRVG